MKTQTLIACALALAGSAVAAPFPVPHDLTKRSPQQGRPGQGGSRQGDWSDYREDGRDRDDDDDDAPIIITPIDIEQDQRTQIIQSTVEKRDRRPVVNPIDITDTEAVQAIHSSVEKRDGPEVNVNQIECGQTINSVVEKREAANPKNVVRSLMKFWGF